MIFFPFLKAMQAHPRRWVFAMVVCAALLCRAAIGLAASPAPGTLIVNTAVVQASDSNGNPLPALSATARAPIAGSPWLCLVKTVDFNPVAPGATLTYTLVYENSGNSPATGVQLVDTLPANVTFQSASADGVYHPADRTVTWMLGTLAAAESGSVTLKVTVAGGLATGALCSNTAVITAKEAISATAAVTTTVGSASNLVLTKTGAPQTAPPDGVITYTLTYHNTGNQSARNVRIADGIPTGTAFVPGSATAPGALSANAVVWELGDVAPGVQGQVRFQVRVSPLASKGDQITNVAGLVTSEQTSKSNTVITDIVDKPRLAISKTAPERGGAGQSITYTIEAVNGAAALTGVSITDPLPAGTTFVSADSGGAPTPDGRQVNWMIGNLAPAQKQTVKMTVLIDASLTQGYAVENIATILSNEAPSQSASARTLVNARTPGKVEFFNGSWQKVAGYGHGDVIFIQTQDLDQNADPTRAESITVVVTNLQTGDAETMTLTETGPDTGIFRGSIPSTLSVTTANSGDLTVALNSRIQVTYTDPLDASPVSRAVALIDPQGTVFNSVSGTPVPGTVVTLRLWNEAANACNVSVWPTLPPGQINPAPPTGTDGKFAFPLAPPGDYCFEVAPPAGYAFPTAVPDIQLPSGFNVGNGSRGDKFTLNAGDPALIRDIPLDPPTGPLTVTKTVSKPRAAIGDIIGYSIKITNGGKAPVTNITLTDVMPHGVQYAGGSSRLNGTSIPDPVSGGVKVLTWKIAILDPGAVAEITYSALVGPDSTRGDGVNTISAEGSSLGKKVISNKAFAKIRITGGIFTDKGTIIGKVFLDRDGNRLQNQLQQGKSCKADEPGIPEVVLYLEDGTRVITDPSGKFSVAGVTPGAHVLRVDETSLPQNVVLVGLSNRFMGDGSSQFVTMTPGGLVQADFAVERRGAEPEIKGEDYCKEEKGNAAPAGPDQGTQIKAPAAPVQAPLPAPLPDPPAAVPEKREDKAAEKTPATSAPAPEAPPLPASVGRVAAAGEEDLVEAIKTMSPDLAFLNPAEGAATARKKGRVVFKAPLGTEPSLYVNGEKIDISQLGCRMEYPPGRVAVFEYVNIHLNGGEKNVLKVEARDPFGIVRGTKDITVAVAGSVDKIVVTTDKVEAVANGRDSIRVSVSLRDTQNIVALESVMAAVSVSAGEIVEKDADPRTEGHQIPLTDGEGSFTVLAPRESGEATLTVGVNDREEAVRIFFLPHLRDLFLVGMGEIKIGQGMTKGAFSYLGEKEWIDEGLYHNGRAAFFMKGKFFKNFLVTAAYDTAKDKRTDLFRENDTTPDTEDKYLIYGDESKTAYEAVSTDKLYFKVEKNRSSLMYGDYKTELNDARLAAYNRSFTGLKYDLNTPGVKLRTFGSYTDQTQVMDALRGKGISGNYYLSKRPVVEGTERVTIEVRDRYRADNVLKRESKSRGSDYEMDYDMGSILFKEPIPSRDSNDNPVYVVVIYESKSDGEKYYVYGGRGSFKLFDKLEIGATGVVEEQAMGKYQLWGVDSTLTLPYKTVIKAEYAGARSLFEETGVYSWQTGQAWSVQAESKPVERLVMKGYFRTLDKYFMNMSAVDVTRGSTKYGVDALYTIRPDAQIRAQYFDESDDLNSMRHRLAALSAQAKYRMFKFSAEISSESSTLNYIPPDSPTTRSPFDASQDIPHELTAVKAGVEADLLKNLSVLVSHKHNLAGDRYHLTQAGLNYKLTDVTRLYVREEYQQLEERAETRTVFGAESQIVKNTVAFNEYRLTSAADGSRNQSVIGLRNKFLLGKAVTGTASGEYLRTLSGAQRQGEPDAVAVALGLEYLALRNTKVTSRLEHRRELIDSGVHTYLGELGMAYKIHRDYSILLKERYFTEEGGSTGRHTASRTIIGLAYRPACTNRLNALAKMEYKHETNSAAAPAIKENAYIFSGEGVWQATNRLQLMGKYAGKFSSNEDFSAYTDLIAARLTFDLTDRWDIGAEYRLMTSHATSTRSHGGSAELGYRIIKNLWVSAGYSFDKFDADLAGDSYQGQGPYMKLRFKFDERTLGNIWKAAPSPQTITRTEAP